MTKNTMITKIFTASALSKLISTEEASLLLALRFAIKDAM